MNRPPRPARRHAWLRVLVLLLALCVPGTHAEAPTTPPVAVSVPGGEGGGLGTETDSSDPALRAPGRAADRPVVRRRPARPPLPAPGRDSRGAVPPSPPYGLRSLRCVVLIC
ncbi:hypothetical protein [Streptomyces broussonetiae]|uniref:Secreted protein n=1 Tax=Streptomyces broussonetiae TaxID=2686304 RepID=A0ABV5E572_9ACTN